jgi:predicted ATPase
LLVLDGCEHLIDGVAELAQHLFDEVGDLHILVTSREALRTQGENIRRLPPLTSPPDGEKLSAAEALAYPSAQLFVDRMVSAGASGALSDADADIVSHMCRQLDGIPLAIELTAGRAGLFGLQDTAAGLNSRFSLLWPGRRTSPSRHQTLNATLDWSYSLLSETERAVLRRLSAFSSSFTFGAAQNVGRGDLGEGQFFEAINGLLAKSLVSTEASGPVARYRLLDTTRAYAKQKLEEAGEREDTRRRHALYYCELLRATAADEIAPDMPTASVVDLDEVRSALQWAFEDGADELLGADVAAYSAPLWLSRALLAEGRAWMAKAAATCIDGDDVPGQQQLRIQIAFASTELFTMGFTEATLATWSRTLERANALGSLPAQLLSYQYLWGGEIRAARYVDALARAETCAAVLREAPDPGAHAMGQWMLGHSKHHTGQFDEARDHLQRSLATDTEAARMASIKATGHDRRVTTQGVLSNVLWILGKPDEAKVWGERAIADARALGFAIPVGLAMSWAGLNTYLSEPDIDVVEGHFVELLEQGRTHSIDSDAGFALCVLGLCQARRNRFDEGSSLVAEGLKALTSARMEVFSVLMRAHICEAAVEAGRLGDALTWMERLESTDWNTDHWCSAEVFRVQGLLAQSQGDERAAAEQMARGIDIARRQGALSWELRATLSASKLWAAQGRTKQALDAIQSVYGKYHQGYGASDLIAAKSMMERLSTWSPGPSRWEPTA